ncbi:MULTISPECIES: LysR family transcriptional regulator [unclassified Paenibacillus]|uniref:LysR family transcriptional regulator n=1 Tax=unclassified Paenibacillus TaxID=185978 RepID=UPI00362EF5BD
MNLQQLKVFVLAVQLQKLYLVAEKLEITQPTVTFHLNKLQEDLGVALFHTKSFHLIKLTEAGKELYHYASQISAMSAEIATLMDGHRAMVKGHLSIGSTHTPATYMLPPLLGELKNKYPRLAILLDVKPAPYIVEKIKRYELDLGIISQTSINDPDLVYEPLVQDDLVVIFHPQHPLAQEQELTPQILSSYPFISHEAGSISRKLIDSWAEQQSISLDISMEVSGSEAMKAAVYHHIGYAMVSKASVESDWKEGKLAVRSIPSWTPERYIYAIRHKNKLVTPAISMFWTMLTAAFPYSKQNHSLYNPASGFGLSSNKDDA